MPPSLGTWFRHHFCFSSLVSIPLLGAGLGIYVLGMLTLDLFWIFIGIAVFSFPVSVFLVVEYFHPSMHLTHQGFLFAYEINDRDLVFKLLRTVPVFKVSIGGIRRVEPRRSADRGLKKLNFLSFLFSQTWYWPVPVRMLGRMFSKVGHERWNYILRCSSGFNIIIVAPHSFISEVGRRLR